MALVRCPKHDIPYNDENPRGCPACWREREGADEATVMRELARASRGAPRLEVLPPPEPAPAPPADKRALSPWPAPVTQPPRVPTPAPTLRERLAVFLKAHWLSSVAILLGVVGLTLLYYVSRPTFHEGYVPPLATVLARPFPVEPNTPIVAAFAMLGTVRPQLNPDSPTLTRFDFGDGAVVDALNGEVYAITLSSPDRRWHGHRVGAGETSARGELALLGPIHEVGPSPASPFPVGGYLAYNGLDALPRKVLSTEVRPPNGCYDVEVVLAPQIIGTAREGEDTLVAVARRGADPTWVVYRVRVVSRSMEGPYAGPPACE
jgi:hypothetical protein